MSTIKSSAEDLTLNADGSGNDVIIQSDGSTKAIITAEGNVGIGTSSPRQNLEVTNNTNTSSDTDILGVESLFGNGGHKSIVWRDANQVVGRLSCQYVASRTDVDMVFGSLYNTGAQSSSVESLRLTADGRGLSQFTAKAWVNYNGTGTPAIRDSHNVSSIGDIGTGEHKINFTNNMATADSYSVASSCCKGASAPSDANAGWTTHSEGLPVTGPYIGTIYNGSASDRNIVTTVIFGD